MKTVFLIEEESHGVIGVATTLRAVKQWLLQSHWVTEHSEPWYPACDRTTLQERYGDRWEEAFYGV